MWIKYFGFYQCVTCICESLIMLMKTIQAQVSFDFVSLTQRPIKASDTSFLQGLYCTSRDHEVLQSGMSESMIWPFLLQQFSLQQKHYHNSYKTAGCKVIEYKGRAIGRLY